MVLSILLHRETIVELLIIEITLLFFFSWDRNTEERKGQMMSGKAHRQDTQIFLSLTSQKTELGASKTTAGVTSKILFQTSTFARVTTTKILRQLWTMIRREYALLGK